MKAYLSFKTIFLLVSLICSTATLANSSSTNTKIKNKKSILNSHYCTVETTISNNNINKQLNPVPDAIYLEADTGQILLQGTSTLNGNVSIQQNNTVFTADNATVNRSNSVVTAQGNVVLSDTNFELKSPLIRYNLDKKTGVIKEAKYKIGTQGVRGESKKINQIAENKLQLEDATFTSCPINKDSWHLASADISLNRETQIGTAKNVTFNVGTTPIFYFPWLKFPINNQRLSGFLSPSIRLQSNAGITIPYYLNLAPNYDATISVTTLRNRGIQLNNEFRYLSKLHQGELEYNYIPNDKSFDDNRRDYFKVNHLTKLNKNTKIKLNAEGVSDVEYFDDFSTSLETSTRPALQRRLEIINNRGPWTLSAAVEDFQILDANDDPYSKLPEFKLNYSPESEPKDLKLDINSEFIYFDRKDSITGFRGDIKSKLSKKFGNEAWYFKPTLSLQHTLYSLENTIGEKHLSRTLPTLTFDSGLFFDRDITNKGTSSALFTQTLEPRLFYSYTPFKNQSNIPIFDTAVSNFSESNQLFLDNRFTGKDRIADTNQLTFAVTSRIQDRNNGEELFKATLGQIFNFNDRKVTLPGGTILTGRRSDLLLELSGKLNDRFRLASTVNLKNDSNSSTNYDLRLNYQDKKSRVANLSLRKLDEELEQISFSTALPINEKWSMVASTDHDIRNDRNLESLIGLEYQDCCWKSRIVVKRFLTSDNVNYETPVFLEFELKGLGNIGKSATRQIKEKIYGYEDY